MKERKPTHYQNLGLEPNVGQGEIKRAYRKLVKSIHPDSQSTTKAKNLATERMIELNEAYEILMDRKKRAQYDTIIGLKRAVQITSFTSELLAEDEIRRHYLQKVFQPTRRMIMHVLNMYKKQLSQLSLDIYDSDLLRAFEEYVDTYESTLRQAANILNKEKCPASLEQATAMMRHCIANAADGLEEMRCFCANFNYDHLTMACNLIVIAKDLSNQAMKLTKC